MSSATPQVLGSDADVVEVGRSMLARGNAVDAVVGAVFAAAGLHASVLMGPVQLLIGGAGAGLRAVDGRLRQPGLGNPRPRGFLPSEPVPPAARVAVPALPAALLAAVTTYGKLSVNAVVSPAEEVAKGRSHARAALLGRIAQRGPAAFAEATVSDELLACAGRLAGGLLSLRDLDELRPALTSAATTAVGDRELVTVPWAASALRHAVASEASGGEGEPSGEGTRVVLAVDRNGLVAVASYEVQRDGLTLDAFDVVAPFSAAPVLRGKERVKPGELRGAAAPIALVRVHGLLDLVAGIGMTTRAESALGRWLAHYAPTSDLERDQPPPPALVAAQRVAAEWSRLSSG